MLAIVFAKLLGMFRDVVLANYFGTSYISDAYLTASTIPTLLFYFIGHAISTAFLPIYNKVRYERGKESADQYANNLMTVSLLLSTVLVVLPLAFPRVVVKPFAPGFDGQVVELAASFVQMSALSLCFMSIVSIWSGYLQAVNNFIVPALISVPRNLIIILSVVLAATVHISFLGIGLLLAYVAEMFLLLPFTRKAGYRARLTVDLASPELRETLYMVLPVLLGTSIGQINKIIDKSLASMLGEGVVSAMSYASVINNAVQEVLVTGLITILFANCSILVAEGKHDEVRKKVGNTTNTLIAFLIPATAGIVLLSKQIVECLLLRGRFDETSAQMTTAALCCYAFGLCFLALRDTFVKIFYAYKMTKIATNTSILAICIGIILKILLAKPFGIYGLALSTSISAVFQSAVLYILLRGKIGALGTRKLVMTTLKVIVATAIMSVGVVIVQALLNDKSSMVQLLVGVSVGVVIYAISAMLFRVPLAVTTYRYLQKSLKNQK